MFLFVGNVSETEKSASDQGTSKSSIHELKFHFPGRV